MYREMEEEQKRKLRSNPNLHKPKTREHRRKISRAMKRYWRTVPHRPITGGTE